LKFGKKLKKSRKNSKTKKRKSAIFQGSKMLMDEAKREGIILEEDETLKAELEKVEGELKGEEEGEGILKFHTRAELKGEGKEVQRKRKGKVF
jgi:hypothetical protein